MALHSKDAPGDAAVAVSRGAVLAGQVDFRRAVVLPDGTRDEAVVTLAVLPDDARPRMGFFLCHQHKPHLVWNPDWLVHRNGADAITDVFYVADDPDDAASRLRAVWGAAAVTAQDGGWRAATAGGTVHALTEAAIRARFSGLALPEGVAARAPCGVAISVHVPDLAVANRFAVEVAGVTVEAARILVVPAVAGGVILEIHARG
jgi:hypothetical protein